MRRTLLSLAAAALMAGCTPPAPEQQIVDDAATALGGRDRILATKTLVIEGSGVNGNLGQDLTPEATSESFTVTAYRRAIDVAAGRARTEQTRTPGFAYFQGQQPQRLIAGIDGAVAYNVAANGTTTRATNAVAADRRAEIYQHPLTGVRAALDPAAKLANPHTANNQSSVDVTTAGGVTFTLAIDATTKLPTRVVSMTDNLNLGDVAIETSFADYQDVGGLKLPARLTTTTDAVMTADIRVAKQALDADTGDLAAPAAAASAAATAGPPPATVTVQEVGKGIWWLAGQSHHSVLVEFADHLMLIEAPQNDARALAVIAKARELRPGKPLTAVVNSHHHFDHSGGIRAAVSEGLTVIAQNASAAFFQNAIERSHSIAPDALAKNPQPLKLETVGDELVLTDAAMTVNLYHIIGSPHASTLLMAYFPKERILVEADVFNPGAVVSPYAANLLENITARKLRVDRIVPLHSTIAPYADFLKVVEKGSELVGVYHPQVVHLAIGLAFAGVGFRFLALTRRASFAGPAATTLILLTTLACFAATQTGTAAHVPVERMPGVRDAVVVHEEWGERTRNLFVVISLFEIAALVLTRRQHARASIVSVAAAVAGLGGLVAIYETAGHGGELVYSYAGGVGIRTGQPEDVNRLFVAGVYQQALQDREQGRNDDAMALVELAAARFPVNLDLQLMAAEWTTDVKRDPAYALRRLDALQIPAENSRARVRAGLARTAALLAQNNRDGARAVLQTLQAEFPNNAQVKSRLDELAAPTP